MFLVAFVNGTGVAIDDELNFLLRSFVRDCEDGDNFLGFKRDHSVEVFFAQRITNSIASEDAAPNEKHGDAVHVGSRARTFRADVCRSGREADAHARCIRHGPDDVGDEDVSAISIGGKASSRNRGMRRVVGGFADQNLFRSNLDGVADFAGVVLGE